MRSAAQKMREQLGGQPAQPRQPLAAAASLPQPLYMAYARVLGAVEAYDLDVSVSVEGALFS